MRNAVFTTQSCTVKRLKEILEQFPDDEKLLFGVNGADIGNTLITHDTPSGIVLEFKV